MADNKGILLPAYVMADESYSMKPNERALAEGMVSLHESLRGEPMIAAKVRLAVLGFSKDVAVRLPLTDVRTEMQLPQLAIRTETSYAAAFQDLLARIPADVRALKNDGYQVHRPVVFFLSDGQPTDDNENAWRMPHSQLIDRQVTPVAPNIIACGIGQAEAQTMLDVATRKEFAFVTVPGADIGRAITEFFEVLTASLVESGRALAADRPELVVERPDPNHFRLAIDMV
ncbi:MAG TPA: hypothetical protein VFU65_11000 [Actinocrinis sp.]|nr:hypothetical protein [Actinocrinis sp.]